MPKASIPSNGPISADPPGRQQPGLSDTIRQPARLAALQRLALLDTPAEQAFDRLTRLATKILHAPVALLSLVDGDRSFFKSSVGLPEHWTSRREMPLSHSVCHHVVATNAPLVINDARVHPLVSDNQAVAELRIVAYLGIPLITSEGHALGTFAVIDTVPREWTPDDVTTLGDLAASALTEIELRAGRTQQLIVEERLHLLESVVGNATAPVLIAEADPAESSDPRIVFVNDAYTRLTGYSLDEVVGKTHLVLNSLETGRSQIDTIRTALTTWKPARLEVFTHRKNGSAFWAELNIVPITDKSGRYSHWVVIQRDISGQKTAEDALRESEARRQAILDSSLDCIITLDSQERVIEFNPAAERTFGYARADVMGKPLVELIVSPVIGGSQTSGLAQYLTTQKDSLLENHLEMTAVRADGTKFPAELAFTTIRLEGPVFTAFLRDISERKQAERRLATQYACTRIIADTVVMDETIPKILRAVCKNLGWCLGQMWQLDPKAGVLRCAVAWHAPAAAVAAFADLSRETTFRPSVGLPGRVWVSREPYWVNDVGSDANFLRAEAATRCCLHGAFAFPILHGEEMLGVMEFFHENILEPDRPLLAMVAAVGSQVGQFIERMRTDEALRRSEERYRSLVLAGSQVVWITHSDGNLVEDSPTWRVFTGQSAEQAQGDGWLAAVHPDDRAPIAKAWAAAMAKKSFYQAEYRVRTAAGEYRNMVARGVPVLLPDGRVREWVGTTTDITEQKRVEEALRESEGRFARTVRGSGAGLWDWNLATNEAYLSPRFKELLRYGDHELANTFASFESHLHPEDHDRVLQETWDYLGQGGLYNTRFRLRTKDDKYRWFEARGQAYMNEAGQAISMAGSLTEIDDLKRTEQHLIQAKEAAEAANRAKSEFFSRMSHELRTPLNVILGFGQLLEMDALSASQRESVDQIVKGGRHLLALINEVLDIARIEAGGAEVVSLEEVDVGAVVGDVLGMILPLANQARLRLLLPQPGTCDRAVRADRQRLKQVLINLLSNAIKYNHEGGTVAVSCAEEASAMLRICVTDTGIGIAPKKMHRLFAPFDRLEADQKGVEGTGLGLTLSKSLVEAMQGTLGVESSPWGSTFWLSCP